MTRMSHCSVKITWFLLVLAWVAVFISFREPSVSQNIILLAMEQKMSSLGLIGSWFAGVGHN